MLYLVHRYSVLSECSMCKSGEGTIQCQFCEVLFCEKCYWVHIREYWTKGGMNPIAHDNFRKYLMRRKRQGTNNILEPNGTKENSY